MPLPRCVYAHGWWTRGDQKMSKSKGNIARIEPLLDTFGADAVLDPHTDDPVEAIKELTRGRGVDLALDCSGAAEARLAAVRSARTWATVCFVGEGGSVTLDVSQDLLRKQLTLIGSWTFSSIVQGECARFVADRSVPLSRLITHRFDLDDAERSRGVEVSIPVPIERRHAGRPWAALQVRRVAVIEVPPLRHVLEVEAVRGHLPSASRPRSSSSPTST